MIAIVDYGMGNLHSVLKALDRLGIPAAVADRPAPVLAADGVILPGVGAYSDAMANLRARGLDQAIRVTARAGRPLLGICLGLQLFFESSEEGGTSGGGDGTSAREGGNVAGLGLLPGQVRRFPSASGMKVPHMGWNRLDLRRPSLLFSGLTPESYVYFVHSYYVEPADPRIVVATTPYGADVPAAVSAGSCYGVQFHPEKSSTVGLRILANFGRLVDAGASRPSAGFGAGTVTGSGSGVGAGAGPAARTGVAL